MRHLLRPIGDRFRNFVAQRRNVALVITFAAGDALPILTMIEGVEADLGSDMFWTFTDRFTAARSYAQAVVHSFAVRHEGVRLAQQKEGMAAWPPIPPRVLSDTTPPWIRLRDLAAFSRDLLPVPNGGVVVWTWCPLEIDDARGYAELMQQILHHEFPDPWCHHLRFVFRDAAEAPALALALQGLPRIEWMHPDLGPEAVRRSIEAEAEDEGLSLDERMSNVLMLAGIDFAEHRYPESLDKYELLVQYHAPAGNHVMGAVALNGMGETYERMGDLERAAESFQAALVPASVGEHPSIPLMLNLTLNLANLRFRQERWEEAEGYYDVAQQLATVARNGPVKVQALDGRGLAQHGQRKLTEAEQSWYAGSVIAAQLEDVTLCRTLVGRLHQLYAETGRREQEQERAKQLAGLDGRDID